MKAVKDETIKKVIDGDARAFEILYNQTYFMAKNIALSLVHNEYDAEDIIQDSYIKLLKNLPNITNTDSLFSYFNKIVANGCKDYQKKRKPNLFSEFAPDSETYDDFEANLATPNKEDYIPEEVNKKAVSKRIRKAVDKLPEDQRSCIILHYFCEMTVDEIAQIYGISRNTVLSRLNYARKKLKKDLQKDKDEGFFGITLFPFIQQAFQTQQRSLPFDLPKRLLFKKTIKTASKAKLLYVSNAYKLATGIFALPLVVQIGAVAGIVAVVATAQGPANITQSVKPVNSSFSNKASSIHFSIKQGDGFIYDTNNNLISCNNNQVCYVDSGEMIYNGPADDYITYDNDLYFMSDNKLVKYNMAKQSIVSEIDIKATNICYTSAITCVNTRDGTITLVDEDGTLTKKKTTKMSNAVFDDKSLYYYDAEGSLMKYNIAKNEYYKIFSGRDNHSMKFAFQVKNNNCYYPQFDSDKTALLHESNGKVIELGKPFVDFGVSENWVYYSGYDNAFYRMDRHTRNEQRIFDKSLCFAGESGGYSAWYDIESAQTYVIKDTSDTFDYTIDGKVNRICIKDGYIFYTLEKEYFCKSISELQKFNG
ncbi:RNA polymerase sigma factor [Eubacterium sp.]|uniref:RNA polymerase sigma factor n=1 Tax=Eubacterium sp. TaxID=142586 RepID=UPI003F06D3B1